MQARKDHEKLLREQDDVRAQVEAAQLAQLKAHRRGGGGDPIRDAAGHPIARYDQIHQLPLFS